MAAVAATFSESTRCVIGIEPACRLHGMRHRESRTFAAEYWRNRVSGARGTHCRMSTASSAGVSAIRFKTLTAEIVEQPRPRFGACPRCRQERHPSTL